MIFFLLFIPVFSTCTTKNYFTECSSEKTRKAIVSKSGDCMESLKSYEDLACDFECPPGTYLDINEVGEQVCTFCEIGTFNIGGGLIYGAEGSNFEEVFDTFTDRCSITMNYQEYYGNCTSWTIKDNILISGTTPYNLPYSTSLKFGVNLVKEGHTTIVYKKASFLSNAGKVGKFSVLVDRVIDLVDDDPNETTWVHHKILLSPGFHEIEIKYSVVTHLDHDLHAYISTITIEGTSYAASKCFKCLLSAISVASGNCQTCDFNEYFDGSECQNCPDNKFSLIGSMSVESCKPRQNCTEKDYIAVYSPCKNSKRNMTYAWKNPNFCDFYHYELPSQITETNCEVCKAGYFSQEINEITVCTACQDGYFISSNQINNTCSACPNGTFAYKVNNYSEWADLPATFETTCHYIDGSYCAESQGWVPSSSYISSGSQNRAGSQITLSKRVQIISPEASVDVFYEIIDYKGGSFNLYANGVLMHTITGKGKGMRKARIDLQKGDYLIQMVHVPSQVCEEEIRLFQFVVFGSTEGGASKCILCPQGYISGTSSASCTACPSGHTSTDSRLECVACVSGYYNEVEGGECKKCPTGTKENSQGTACLAEKYLPVGNSTYYMSPLAESAGGICESLTSASYCFGTFYGPIPSDSSVFYISVLSPSQLSLPGISNFFEPKLAYAHALIKKSDLKGIKGIIHENCSDQSTLVNLGTVVSSINKIENGFQIRYEKGDVCDVNNNVFSMEINMICDKNIGDGWPSFNRTQACHHVFNWVSRYACRMCKYSELETIESRCLNGKKKFAKRETSQCIYPFSFSFHWEEPCSEIFEHLSTIPMKIGLILLLVLVLTGILSVIFYQREKILYQRLESSTSSPT